MLPSVWSKPDGLTGLGFFWCSTLDLYFPIGWEIPLRVVQLVALDLVRCGKMVLLFAWDKPHSLE